MFNKFGFDCKVRNLWWWCYPYFFRPRSCSALPSLAPWLHRISLLPLFFQSGHPFLRRWGMMFTLESYAAIYAETHGFSFDHLVFAKCLWGDMYFDVPCGIKKRLFSGTVGCIKLVLSQFHPVETTIIHPQSNEFKQSFLAYTIWLFNIAMENGPFIDGLPGFTC